MNLKFSWISRVYGVFIFKNHWYNSILSVFQNENISYKKIKNIVRILGTFKFAFVKCYT